ncbi:hypothetical protein [Liquorilactobacillus nagelii]|uniref:hypothetical protein n=1 Tax=Liquorilactobacillus nagelii TaxID=82688 RepID=UPI001CCDDB3C|nr:hypothetical protein [Liquorilactobacillus nagelii]ULQ50011.1 hypothetical protein J6864_02990 [Liquorilactobacillus nagelii]
MLKQMKIPISIVQARIEILEQRLKNPSTGISNIHGWLNDPVLDSLMKANAIQNYRAAWNLFRKVHRSGAPVFHNIRDWNAANNILDKGLEKLATK